MAAALLVSTTVSSLLRHDGQMSARDQLCLDSEQASVLEGRMSRHSIVRGEKWFVKLCSRQMARVDDARRQGGRAAWHE